MRVGIDLGTTYCAVAYRNEQTGKPELIKNRYGNRLTPSVLAFVGNEILYGEEAAEYIESSSICTATYYKRHMGDEGYGYDANGHVCTAKDLSACLLKSLIRDARKEVGERISEAVITVPAYFTHKERKATIEAAGAAGLKVLHLMNEPTAAIYAYGAGRELGKKKLLVYDLGGGTFDVSIAEITKQKISILGSDGNHDLGGKEWDDVLARYICDVFYGEFGIDLAGDRSEMLHILAMAERIKKRLSVASNTDFVISYLGKSGKYAVTKKQFERLSEDLLQITIRVMQRLLKETNLKKEQIDGILLTGGATRMPMVRRAVEGFFEKDVLHGINVDEAVAIGAAIKAAEIEAPSYYLPGRKKEERPQVQFTEFLPGKAGVNETIAHSLGMATVSKDGKFYINSIIIPKNTPVPVSNTRAYRFTTAPGVNEMEIYLLQGEDEDPRNCQLEGRYLVHGIADGNEGEVIVDITYSYNEEGLIEVKAAMGGEQLEVEEIDGVTDLSFLKETPKRNRKNPQTMAEGELYLAVDLSGSMSGAPLLQAKKAMEEFIGRLNINRLSIGLIGFADKAEMILSPTKDMDRIMQSIINMRVDGNRFGYGNAASPFSIVYERHMNQQGIGKDYLILLTDGVWAYKENAIREAKKCREEEIEIHALGFGSADEKFMNEIVSQEEFAEMTELASLTNSFCKIAQSISF